MFVLSASPADAAQKRGNVGYYHQRSQEDKGKEKKFNPKGILMAQD